MNKVWKLLIYLANLGLYYFSLVLPKRKKVWVFGAWFGQRYADNTRALFEYCNENHSTDIQCIWLSENKDVVKKVRQGGNMAYYTYSFAGYYYSLIAGMGFVVTGKKDLNHFVVTSKMVLVNLWHGTPLKKIMYDDTITFKNGNQISAFLFPFLRTTNYSIITATSSEVKHKFTSAFKVSSDKVQVVGYPRNDVLLQNSNTTNSQVKRGVYMPTHRGEGKNGESFIKYVLASLSEIDQNLKECNIELYVKLHYYHNQDVKKVKDNFSSIRFVEEKNMDDNLYEFLSTMDFMITDYSSVYFDFLLLDRPIIFFPFDIEHYLKHDREFYYDYNDVTPGKKVFDSRTLLDEMKKVSINIDEHKQHRAKVNDLFNEIQESKSSELIYLMLKEKYNL